MFKSALAATALTVGALGATAGVANASTPDIEHNEHANTGDGVNVVVSDILTNADILDTVNVLNGALNGLDVL